MRTMLTPENIDLNHARAKFGLAPKQDYDLLEAASILGMNYNTIRTFVVGKKPRIKSFTKFGSGRKRFVSDDEVRRILKINGVHKGKGAPKKNTEELQDKHIVFGLMLAQKVRQKRSIKYYDKKKEGNTTNGGE